MAATYQTHGKGVIQAIVSLITIGVSIGFLFKDYQEKGTLFILGMCFLCFNLGLWYKGDKVHKSILEKREKYKKYIKNTRGEKTSERQKYMDKTDLKLKQKEEKVKNNLKKKQEKAKKKFEDFKRKMGLTKDDTVVEMEERSKPLEDAFEFKTLELKLGQKIDEEVGDDLDNELNKGDDLNNNINVTGNQISDGVNGSVEKTNEQLVQKKGDVENALDQIKTGINNII